jgi:hypothetical protein
MCCAQDVFINDTDLCCGKQFANRVTCSRCAEEFAGDVIGIDRRYSGDIPVIELLIARLPKRKAINVKRSRLSIRSSTTSVSRQTRITNVSPESARSECVQSLHRSGRLRWE